MNIEIDNDIAQKLQTVAAIKNVSVSELLRSFAIEQERYWRELEEDMHTLEAMNNGEYITHEDMMDYLEQLDSSD